MTEDSEERAESDEMGLSKVTSQAPDPINGGQTSQEECCSEGNHLVQTGVLKCYTHTQMASLWPRPSPVTFGCALGMSLPVITTFVRILLHMCKGVCSCCGCCCRYSWRGGYTYRSRWPSKLIKPDTLIKSCPISPRYEEKSQSILHILLLWSLELGSGTFGQCSAPETQAR